MQKQFGAGFIPYEIGDKIILKGENNTRVRVIEDIKMIQYIKEPRVEFEVFLSDLHIWIASDKVKERVL